MKRLLIKKTKQKIGQHVKIAGWVQTIRNQSNIQFLIIRDISGTIQVVAEKKDIKIDKFLNLESVIEIEGIVKKEKQAPDGVEITAKKICCLSTASPELPIPIVEKGNITSQQKRLDWRWLDLRKPEKQLIFKVWTCMEQAFRDYLISQNFIQIHSPKFMSTASESGSELFEVKYFERKAYLAQSPQFYKQMAMSAGFERVFEIGPIFRANPSFTSRHDTEFTGYDLEMSFVNSHQDIIELLEKLSSRMIQTIKEKYGNEIEKYYNRKLIVPKIPFPQLTMTKAKKILKKLDVLSEKEGDLSPEEERKICKYVREKYHHEFVFIADYPISVRPFYHMRQEKNPKITKSFDLLWNGIEITTGAQREHRYDVLKKQAHQKRVKTIEIEGYLNFFKYGCPPHGGFGFGPSRFLTKIFNVSNVREVTYIYRGINRLNP